MAASSSLRLTDAGRRALQSETAVAPELRRVLSLVEFQSSTRVIRAQLRRFADASIDKWLAELERLGLAEPMPDAPAAALRFDGVHAVPVPPVLEQDDRRLADEAWAASNRLTLTGAYVAHDRVKSRTRAARPPGELDILLVEDDPDQLALARQRLGAAGYRIRHAASARDLRETLEAGALPDLLLLDVMLPDGDGFDILGNLRRHPRYCDLPVMMVTVKSDPADIRAGIGLGADGYVTKPYNLKTLLWAIAQVAPTTPPTRAP